MAAPEEIDLTAPVTSDTLLEIRSGKMAPLPGIPSVLSAINKTPFPPGPVYIGPLGIPGDEHDLTFHGGPDKAILAFCKTHYPPLATLHPSAAPHFIPGAFGENFVVSHLNELNVHIGDVHAVGPDLRLQVSQPRGPCFKLNQRFGLKNFAPTTWQMRRTGWYYRVLTPGSVCVGDEVGTITVGIKPSPQAAGHHVFVAAGVGITAFLALVERMKATNWSCVLHYGVRSAEDVPFRERLEKLGDSVVIYDKSKGQRLDIPGILEGMPWNSHVYFCGPARLMQEAAREVKAKGIPEKEVHFEAFEADLSGDPFEAVVANRGGKVIKVGEEETLLEILQANFEDVASSCSVGNCGTCKIGLKEGRVEHRGTALTEEEKSTSMLACVSRGMGRITIEI